MKLTVETKPFRVAVEEAGRCIRGKQTIPILGNLGLMSDPDTGTLRVIGTDLEVGRIETIGATIREAGAVTVPKKLLVRYLQGCKDQELRIETDDKSNVRVNEACFSGLSFESFPDLPKVPDTPVADLKLDYLSLMLKRSCSAISSEVSRFTLNGSLLELEDKVMRVVSTDGHRMMLQEAVRPDDGKFKVLVPKFACMEMGAVKSKAFGVRLYANDDHLWFQWADSTFIARKLTGNFPDYQRVMVKEGEHGIVFEADVMLAAVKAALPFADERSHCLWFAFNGACTITAESVESGRFQREVPLVVGPTKPVNAGFCGTYLVDLLQYCKGQQVAALLTIHKKKEPEPGPEVEAAQQQPAEAEPDTANGATLWQTVQSSGPSLQYVLMPMRS